MRHDHNMDNEKIIEKYNNHLRFEKNLSDNTIRNYLSDLSVFASFLIEENFSKEQPFQDFAKFILIPLKLNGL